MVTTSGGKGGGRTEGRKGDTLAGKSELGRQRDAQKQPLKSCNV